jgi:histone acetyltransferase (RNA polymerase elongator complex component)
MLIFKKLLEIPDLNITCQARFESCIYGDKAKEFIRLCAENKHRVHLEFGLQTIHENEMAIIGRKNRIDRIEKALAILKENQIDYETSIIYAIPGQTVESFLDTIEFLIANGCKTIKAYPLQIPKNSKMENRRDELSITFGTNNYNVKSVNSTYSFPAEQREDMDRIAARLNSGQLTVRKDIGNLLDEVNYEPISKYLWKIQLIETNEINPEIIEFIQKDYISPTMQNISIEDHTQSALILGQLLSLNDQTKYSQFITDLISGKQYLELKRPQVDLESLEEVYGKGHVNNFNPALTPKK